jgi:hypothetical protein
MMMSTAVNAPTGLRVKQPTCTVGKDAQQELQLDGCLQHVNSGASCG